MTSHIASRISRTRWKNVFLAQTSSISIFTTPRGSHEKGSLFSQVVENAREKSRANYLKQSAEDQFLCICG